MSKGIKNYDGFSLLSRKTRQKIKSSTSILVRSIAEIVIQFNNRISKCQISLNFLYGKNFRRPKSHFYIWNIIAKKLTRLFSPQMVSTMTF